jgi:hypothetical protein
MKLDYLGDSLDFFKGAVLSRLESEGLVRNLKIVPMFSDAAAWTPNRIGVYASLLGKAPQDVQPEGEHALFPDNLDFYRMRVKASCETGDLFIDPDTGIEPEALVDSKHLRRSDLDALVLAEASRLVIVYQHNARREMEQDVQSWRKSLGKLSRGTIWGVFHGGHAALILLSRAPDRVTRALDALKRYVDAGGESPSGPKRIFGSFTVS